MHSRFSIRQWGMLVSVVLAVMVLILAVFLITDRSRKSNQAMAKNSSSMDSSSAADISIVPLDSTEALEFGGGYNEAYQRLSELVLNLAAQYQGSIGIALVPVNNPSRSIVLGDRLVAPAWSTLHVPIAMALMKGHSIDTDQLGSFIQETNTDVAAQYYSALGAPPAASVKVNDILRQGGDTTTALSAGTTKPCSVTAWSLFDQANWAANIRKISGSELVLQAMSDNSGASSFGLGHVDGAIYKTGWGVDFAGDFSVRQFGLAETPFGEYGVSLLVHPGDGSFGTAQIMANDLVRALAQVAFDKTSE
ncbi:MAG: hypothetical protein Q3972_07245 [Corynebacterium sp.]|nr:hypothetical protein [Corynebacterium sp.]